MADSILVNARNSDWSPRVVATSTVDATPSGATETTIAHVTLASGLTYQSGVTINASVNSLHTAASTATYQLKIKRGTTLLLDSLAVPCSASANIAPFDISFFDATPGDAPTYNVTLTLASAGGAATNLTACVTAIAV